MATKFMFDFSDDVAEDRFNNVIQTIHERVPALIRTWLTEEELAEHDLRVVIDPAVPEMRQAQLHLGSLFPRASRWLTRIPSVPAGGSDFVQQSWLPIVEDRITDLKALAVEEELLFDSVSADAALRFVGHLPHVRQPSTFLVNGNIRLVWRNARGEQIGLQFRGADKIQFVYLEREGDDLDSTMGMTSAAKVMKAITSPDMKRILVG